MNRALPGPMIDLVRDGVPDRDLRVSGGHAVRRALLRTATSACQRGWAYSEWVALVDSRASNLGTQTRLDHRRVERPRRAVERAYRTVWEEAARWVAEAPPPFTKADALNRVEDIARTAATADLDVNERRVMTYALDVARSIGTDRPALPRRGVAEGTGLSEKSTRCAIERLIDAGWLVLEERGIPSPRGGRASLYRLNTPQPLAAVIPLQRAS